MRGAIQSKDYYMSLLCSSMAFHQLCAACFYIQKYYLNFDHKNNFGVTAAESTPSVLTLLMSFVVVMIHQFLIHLIQSHFQSAVCSLQTIQDKLWWWRFRQGHFLMRDRAICSSARNKVKYYKFISLWYNMEIFKQMCQGNRWGLSFVKYDFLVFQKVNPVLTLHLFVL